MHMERDRTMEKQRFCSSCKDFYSPNGGYETGRIQDQNLRHNMGTQKTVCKGQVPCLHILPKKLLTQQQLAIMSFQQIENVEIKNVFLAMLQNMCYDLCHAPYIFLYIRFELTHFIINCLYQKCCIEREKKS